jgi:hypothetical protein
MVFSNKPITLFFNPICAQRCYFQLVLKKLRGDVENRECVLLARILTVSTEFTRTSSILKEINITR